MRVAIKRSDDYTITGPTSRLQKALALSRPGLGQLLMGLQRSARPDLHSLALLPSGLVAELNAADADILHLHWICGEFLSIEDIGRLTKPLVWTMHDMWPFAGAEHYSDDKPLARWRTGYQAGSQPTGQRGLDLDRWVWRRKHKAWQRPIHLVAPSEWLAGCARESALMRAWSINTIPHALDVQSFQPYARSLARHVLNLPHESRLVLFGALGGGRDQRKGWDLLQPALAQLARQIPGLTGIIFGQSQPAEPPDLGLPLHWMGHLHDDATLALLYNACDVMVVPSRQEAFGQTAAEAQACGCPVVTFRASGLPSVVEHQVTGYLATPFEADDLAAGIAWVLAEPTRYARLASQARERAVRLWSPDVVVAQYTAIYQRYVRGGCEGVYM